MSTILSTADAKHLLRLCKLGRLFEVQDWIAEGRSLSVPADLRTTPLKVALDTRFHSLVELLVRNEPSKEVKNRCLLHALSLKRLDFIELLVAHGADPHSIAFVEVLQNWEPTIIRFFLDRGADFLTGSPFEVAFSQRIRTALRPFKECRERQPEFASQLQEQADRALRHFCAQEDLKWVSLLMWVGADPRSRGPTLCEEDQLDESTYTTAMEAAAYAKDALILKRLKPDAERDDIDKLLAEAATFGRVDTVRYLLGLGARPNDKPNGGSTALDKCLGTSLRCESFGHRRSSTWYGYSSKASTYSVSKTLDTVRLLLENGAQWRPSDGSDVSLVRRNLFECDPEVTLEVVELMLKHNACTSDIVQTLLQTTAMRKHLVPVVRKLGLLRFDVRTMEQKREEKRQKEAYRKWALRELASRYNRDKIYEEIWSEPIQHVAKRYGISDVGLAKVCRKLDVPRPGRGYWAIRAAGKRLPRKPPLPELPI